MLLDGEDVFNMSEAQLLNLRRHRLSMVFQHFGLFPHQQVIDNVAYGLEVQGIAKEIRHERAKEVLDLVSLAGWEYHYPNELSGGMQQRVGIARALAVDPEILMFDEPFSALDPLIRRGMQDELISLQQDLQKTILFITHDFLEAVKLGDRIAIMKDGQIVQIGTPTDVFDRPASVAVASFIGSPPMNMLDGQIQGRQLSVHGHTVTLPHRYAHADGPVTVGVRPGNLRLDRAGIPTTLYLAENLGENWLLNLHLGEKLIKLRTSGDHQMQTYAAGDTLLVSFEAGAVHLFDSDSGKRLVKATENETN